VDHNTDGGSGPSLNITTTQANSAIVVACGDWNQHTGARTWRQIGGVSPVEVTYDTENQQDAYTVYGAYHANAGSAGSKAVGLSAPGSMKYSIVAVEIKAQ
jgi:hypothetical protein